MNAPRDIKILTIPYAQSERTKVMDMLRQLLIEGRQFAVDQTDRFINVSFPATSIKEQPATV